MHTETPSFDSSSASRLAAYFTICVGISPMGHAAWQRPQRMQSRCAFKAALRLLKASTALLLFSSGTLVLTSACPIMGPPERIL